MPWRFSTVAIAPVFGSIVIDTFSTKDFDFASKRVDVWTTKFGLDIMVDLVRTVVVRERWQQDDIDVKRRNTLDPKSLAL